MIIDFLHKSIKIPAPDGVLAAGDGGGSTYARGKIQRIDSALAKVTRVFSKSAKSP